MVRSKICTHMVRILNTKCYFLKLAEINAVENVLYRIYTWNSTALDILISRTDCYCTFQDYSRQNSLGEQLELVSLLPSLSLTSHIIFGRSLWINSSLYTACSGQATLDKSYPRTPESCPIMIGSTNNYRSSNRVMSLLKQHSGLQLYVLQCLWEMAVQLELNHAFFSVIC